MAGYVRFEKNTSKDELISEMPDINTPCTLNEINGIRRLKRVENRRECAFTLLIPMEFPMKLIQLRQAGSLYTEGL